MIVVYSNDVDIYVKCQNVTGKTLYQGNNSWCANAYF